ncbi:MAG: hypothetical protein K9G46_01330 [Flavobacteriales bacterium]|nr:hypothetical protein [Flavobacteriales bacterium]
MEWQGLSSVECEGFEVCIMTKTHWRRVDYRAESLRVTIGALDECIESLLVKTKTQDWYDGVWLLEESEPIIGLGFVAFQNYVNSSIYDRHEELVKQYEKYSTGAEKLKNERTKVELIIAIANYFKHRDSLGDLHEPTRQILADFKLNYAKDADVFNSPILKGFDILSEKNELSEIMELIFEWRKSLWLEEN